MLGYRCASAREVLSQFAARLRLKTSGEGKVYGQHFDLMVDPKKRVPPDVPPDTPLEKYYADYYSRSDYQRRMLPQFIDRPLVRTQCFASGQVSARVTEHSTRSAEGKAARLATIT